MPPLLVLLLPVLLLSMLLLSLSLLSLLLLLLLLTCVAVVTSGRKLAALTSAESLPSEAATCSRIWVWWWW
jgi:hypothetical protein